MIEIYIRDIDEGTGKFLCSSAPTEIEGVVNSIKTHGANLGDDDAVYYDARFCQNYNDQRLMIFEIVVSKD